MKVLKYLFIALFISIHLYACDKSSEPTPVTPPIVVVKKDLKVLFIGNSFTFYNDGVDYHLQKMLNAITSKDTTYFVDKIAVSSYTLEAHYGDVLTMNKLKSQKWTTVVLQEQSTRPINNPALFLQYATYFDVEIKKLNAKTMLFMTWAEKTTPGDMNALATSYISVGAQLDTKMAPVGRVWESLQAAYPLIELYISDNKHPTLSGTYLIACVFYYSLYAKNPVNNAYVPSGMSTENVVAIRKTVYEYMKSHK